MTSNKTGIWRVSSCTCSPVMCVNFLLKVIAASLSDDYTSVSFDKSSERIVYLKNRIYYTPQIAFIVHL